MQVEGGESKLLLFETFSLFYYYFFSSHERVLEELALLKITILLGLNNMVDNQDQAHFKWENRRYIIINESDSNDTGGLKYW